MDLETRADPFTERIVLEPDEVAIPGLTDAHLHLAGAASSRHDIDLSDAATLDEGARPCRHRPPGDIGPGRVAGRSRLELGSVGPLADCR